REDLMNVPHPTRRDFTAALGGIVVSFSLGARFAPAQQPAPLPGSLGGNRMLDAWLRINADGTATVFTGKVELGQGIITALAQIAAEELDLPLTRVHMMTADTARSPNEGQTAGSQSIENGGTALRLAGAEVRAMLPNLAAQPSCRTCGFPACCMAGSCARRALAPSSKVSTRPRSRPCRA